MLSTYLFVELTENALYRDIYHYLDMRFWSYRTVLLSLEFLFERTPYAAPTRMLEHMSVLNWARTLLSQVLRSVVLQGSTSPSLPRNTCFYSRCTQITTMCTQRIKALILYNSPHKFQVSVCSEYTLLAF